MVEKIAQLNAEKNIFWTLAGVLFFCMCFYVYSINMTVRNVVLREAVQSHISALVLSNSSEEFKYVSAQNSVTLAMAYSLGFKDVSQKMYLSKTAPTVAMR